MKFLTHGHRNVLAAALLLFPSALQAGSPAPGGAAAPQGKLDIRLLITEEPEKVLRPAKGATAPPATIVAPGHLLVGFIFFKDCKPDAKGNCNLDVDVQGLTPSGAPFLNQKAANLWRNKQAPHTGFVQLGVPNIKIQLEPKDPAGTYRVIAVAHDRNNGAESRSEASFQVK